MVTGQGNEAAFVTAKHPSSSSGPQRVVVDYRQYRDEHDLPYVMDLIDNELSEPYSIFTYRYFLHSWPGLCFLAFDGSRCFGTIVCKLELHGSFMRGYIAMLVVEKAYRGLGVGKELVKKSIEDMIRGGADEVVLEAEITNVGALRLYEGLGFLRDKRLIKYYMNGNDAFRLKLLLPLPPERLRELEAAPALQALTLGEHERKENDPAPAEALHEAPQQSVGTTNPRSAAAGRGICAGGAGPAAHKTAQDGLGDAGGALPQQAKARPGKGKGKKGRKR